MQVYSTATHRIHIIKPNRYEGSLRIMYNKLPMKTRERPKYHITRPNEPYMYQQLAYWRKLIYLTFKEGGRKVWGARVCSKKSNLKQYVCVKTCSRYVCNCSLTARDEICFVHDLYWMDEWVTSGAANVMYSRVDEQGSRGGTQCESISTASHIGLVTTQIARNTREVYLSIP